MTNVEVEQDCSKLPVLDCEVPASGLELDLVLQPINPVGRDAQYWPLFHAASPGEQFGNMRFRFGGNRGVVTLNITLDLSLVPGRDLEFSRGQRGNLDGIIALSPDFRHQFRARARAIDGDYTKLVVKIRDKNEIPDNFSFLWLCQDASTGMHFVSGDPDARLEPQ